MTTPGVSVTTPATATGQQFPTPVVPVGGDAAPSLAALDTRYPRLGAYVAPYVGDQGGAVSGITNQPAHGPYAFLGFNQPGAAFTGSPFEAAWLWGSADGKDFHEVAVNPVLSVSPGLRDQSVIKVGDTWFMAATKASTAAPTCTSFPIYQSTDLVYWRLVATVDCTAATAAAPRPAPADAPSAWGPQFYQDPLTGNIYIFVTVNVSTIYWLRATDMTGLTTWTTPTAVAVNNLPVGCTEMSDTAIVLIGSTYHVFFTDDTHSVILHATATTVTGPWTVTQSGDWAGWGTFREAPCVVQVGTSRWRIYVDQYSNLGYQWSETVDRTLSSGWSTPVTVTVDGNANNAKLRHGTFIPLTSLDAVAVLIGSRRAVRPVVTTSTKRLTSGNITVSNQNTWTVPVDGTGATDPTVDAKPGDLITLTVCALWNAVTGTNNGRLDAATMVGGVITNWVSTRSSSPNQTIGEPRWSGPETSVATLLPTISAAIPYIVQAADLYGGRVTFRLFCALGSAAATASETLFAIPAIPLDFTAINYSS